MKNVQTRSREFIKSLKGYGVLNGKWEQHPDFRHLTNDQRKQLRRDIAESLFLAGWLDIQISEDKRLEEKKAANRRAIDYWNRIARFHKRPIPALNLWIADAWGNAWRARVGLE